MDIFDWAAIVSILITGTSAIIGASLNTTDGEERPEQAKRGKLAKRLNAAGWAAVILAVASTITSLALSIKKMDEERIARRKSTLAEDRAEKLKSLLEAANGQILTLTDIAKRQEVSLAQQAVAFRQESLAAQRRWETADNRANQSTLRLLDEQRRSQEAITREQRSASEELQYQQVAHQRELSRQHDLTMASLLGRVAEAPQAEISIPLSISFPQGVSPARAYRGGVLKPMLLDDASDLLSTENCALDLRANIAELRPAVPALPEVVEYGWRASFCWLDGDFTAFAVAGPQELMPPSPRLDVYYDLDGEKKLVAVIRSGLKVAVSASNLYGSSGLNRSNVSLVIRLSEAATTNDLEKLAARLDKLMGQNGEFWLLVDSSSGLCSRSELIVETSVVDFENREVRKAWNISSQSVLRMCQDGLFRVQS